MADKDFLKQLKQVNISKDGEKTKERFRQVWKAAPASKKKEVRELAGVSANTIYRIANTGSINAKLAIALAQVLNADPLYLTGEADEAGEYTEKAANSLLRKYGSGKGLRRRQRSPKIAAPEQKADTAENQDEICAPALSGLNKGVIANLSGDKMLILFESLRTKASAGVPGSREKVERILELLLY